MTGEVNNRLIIHLTEELCFILTKSNLLHCKIYNSFSHKVEHLSYLGFTCFINLPLDFMECRSLGCRSMMRNQTDHWPRVVSCCLIGLM